MIAIFRQEAHKRVAIDMRRVEAILTEDKPGWSLIVTPTDTFRVNHYLHEVLEVWRMVN